MENEKNESKELEVVNTSKEKEESPKTEVVEKKEETKKYNQENLTRSIVYAAIILVLVTLHGILGFIEGNLPWFIINTIFTAAGVVMIILTALLFFRKTMNNLKNDIPSFVVSLVALVIITGNTIGWSIDMIRNLIGFLKDLTQQA